MTNKSISFKRIALVVVAALGFGVVSTGPSNAYVSLSPALALSASTLSVAPGDTGTITATVNFTSDAKEESVNVIMNDAYGSGTVPVWLRGLTTDSINVRTAGTEANAGVRPNLFSVFGSANSDSQVSGTSTGMYVPSNASGTTPVAVQAKISVNYLVPTSATAGTYYYTITLRSTALANLATASLALTITAKDLTATAAKSQLFVNQALCATGLCNGPLSGNGSSSKAYATEADSALVVSAGTPATGGTQSYTAVGYMFGLFKNASDTVTVTGSDVTGTMTVSLSGPGALSSRTASTKVKSLTITQSNDTITIWSDGTPGTATITGYIGSTALTQAAKTVVFYGKAATITATETSVVRANGGAALSSRPADSLTVGTQILTFTAKDSAGNAVTNLAMNSKGTLYCVSSDTSIIGTGTGSSATDAYKAATAQASGVWSCDMVVRAAGTASITVADESVVANSAVTSTAKTFTFAKPVVAATAYKGIGTITFDKTSYNIGDQALITVTVKNAASGTPGMVKVAGDEIATSAVFPTLNQNRAFSGYVTSGGVNYGFNGTGTTFDLTNSSFVNGVETYVVFMPTTAGKVTLTGFTTDGTNDTATAVSVSVDVVDPIEAVVKTQVALANATAAAAQASADAATDAALQAIDAANAATDAANLAAEAADAATVAAQESKDAADAATAAVESLATQVATLMAALQAQITSLANVVAKIAKKVKA